MEREKECLLMLSSRLSINVGATTRFSMQVALVDADLYFDAMFKSGKTFLITGDKRSWKTSGTLEQAVRTDIFSSASVVFLSSNDWTGVKLSVG